MFRKRTKQKFTLQKVIAFEREDSPVLRELQDQVTRQIFFERASLIQKGVVSYMKGMV